MKSICAFLLTLAASCGACLAQAKPKPLDGIVAVVYDAIITARELDQATAPAVTLLERQYRSQRDVFQKKYLETLSDGLDQLIDRELILNEFKSAGWPLPESIVDDDIKERIRRRFGDRVAFIKTLQAEGLTLESYRKKSREDIIIGIMVARNISSDKTLISPAKIERYYADHEDQYRLADQVRLRMLVLNIPGPEFEGSVRVMMKEIVAKLDQGASFEEMASIYSEGSHRKGGGDRGWEERSALREELAEAAFKLKVGERSKVIETPEAHYLLQLEDRRPAHVKPLDEVRDEIEKALALEERSRLQKRWLGRLREKAFIRSF